VHLSQQVAYATAYRNVTNLHPSEPNHIWAEAGSNFGVFDDNEPYSTNRSTVQNIPLHLSHLLAQAGIDWKSYQEDIDLTSDSDGHLTNVVLPPNQWKVPLRSISGTLARDYVNQYNGSNQYDYAAKHNPMLFFLDTNGGNNTNSNNPLSLYYAPLQQLAIDLTSDSVAAYNWITPNQNNDMHTTLNDGYKGLTGDDARIRQGDDFLSQVIPMIMASKAYRNQGAIIIWWDESESDGVEGDNPDDPNHTIGEIVISGVAHRNVEGMPYASYVNYTHSSDLRTMQEIFQVQPFLGDAGKANDLSDLFQPGSITEKPCSDVELRRSDGFEIARCRRK
jgi:hypothetical protein